MDNAWDFRAYMEADYPALRVVDVIDEDSVRGEYLVWGKDMLARVTVEVLHEEELEGYHEGPLMVEDPTR